MEKEFDQLLHFDTFSDKVYEEVDVLVIIFSSGHTDDDQEKFVDQVIKCMKYFQQTHFKPDGTAPDIRFYAVDINTDFQVLRDFKVLGESAL